MNIYVVEAGLTLVGDDGCFAVIAANDIDHVLSIVRNGSEFDDENLREFEEAFKLGTYRVFPTQDSVDPGVIGISWGAIC